MKTYHKVLIGIGIVASLIALAFSVAYAAPVTSGSGGGTGFGSTSTAAVGKCLQVASTSPFLTYQFGTCSGGGGGSGGLTTSTNGSYASGNLSFYINSSTVSGDDGINFQSSTKTLSLIGPSAELNIGSSGELTGRYFTAFSGGSQIAQNNGFIDFYPQHSSGTEIIDPGTSFLAALDTSLLSANRNFQFPDASGILCLTSTCGAGGSYSATGTANQVNVFTSTSKGLGYPNFTFNPATGLLNASSVQATIYDTGGFGFHAAAYGATCNGVADDSAAYQTTANLAGAARSRIISASGTCLINTPVNLSSNTVLFAVRGGTTFKSTNSGANHSGIFDITNTNNVVIDGPSFNVASGTTAITSYGHNGLTIQNSEFTGAGNFGTQGIITLYGLTAATSFTNTTIKNNYFHDMPTSTRVIYLYSRNGNTISDTDIKDNTFASTTGAAVFMDDFSPIYRTTVTGNHFLNLYGGAPHTAANTGVALNGGVSTPGIETTIFSNNQYINTITTSTDPGANQGVVYMYAASGTIISDNTMIGAWSPTMKTVGPAIALGNLGTPDYHTIISGNTIQGFDGPIDPDSQFDTSIYGNVVSYAGGCFGTGYGSQVNISIHDNTCLDTGLDKETSFAAWVTFANASPVNSSYYNNTLLLDTTSIAPTTTILLTGNFDYSGVRVFGNTFNTTSTGISTSSLFTKQGGSEVLPTYVYGNQVTVKGQTTADVGGMYPQLGIGNIFTATNTFAANISSTLKNTLVYANNAGVFVATTTTFISTTTFNSTGTSTFFPFWNSSGNLLTPTSSLAQLSGGAINDSSSLTVASTINNLYFGYGTAGVTSNLAITTNPFLVTGDNNIAIGQGVMQTATGSVRNVGVGSQALHSLDSANSGFNTAVGSNALNAETTGSGSNVAVGYNAFNAQQTGDNGVAVGRSALDQSTNFGNTALGSQAGHTLTTGSSNSFFGRDAGNNGSQKVDAANSTAIGNGSFTTASNQMSFGNSSVNQYLFNCGVAIGATTSSPCLNVGGSFNVNGTGSILSGLALGTNLILPSGYLLNLMGSNSSSTGGTEANITNSNSGAFSEYVLTQDIGTSSNYYAGFGIDNSAWAGGVENPGDTFIEASTTGGMNFEIVTSSFRFFIGGISASTTLAQTVLAIGSSTATTTPIWKFTQAPIDNNGNKFVTSTSGGTGGNGNVYALATSTVIANNFLFYLTAGSSTVSATSVLSELPAFTGLNVTGTLQVTGALTDPAGTKYVTSTSGLSYGQGNVFALSTSTILANNFLQFKSSGSSTVWATSSIFSINAGTSDISIGTTTDLGLFGAVNSAGTIAIAVASTTNGTSSTPWFNLIATSSIFQILASGHINATGTTPVLSACGTSPSIRGSDTDGEVTVGSVSATSCTITFQIPYEATPTCVVTSQTAAIAVGYSYTTTALTVTNAALTSDKINYSCKIPGL